MARALELAARGQGFVEPNPMVGCVIVRDDQIVGEGFHARFGGPHAEVEAILAAGDRTAGATMFVTLEPCCHFGKTPPCSNAVIAAGIRRVIVAMRDPFPAVDSGGLQQLTDAGIAVEVGLGEAESRALNAPYLTLVEQRRPWVIGKWAMTLDGKIATRTGDSRWISNEASRAIVHHLRGRMDAIVVGIGTALADDPLLTARPAGSRIATRVVLDSQARLPVTSQLVRSVADAPVLLVTTASADTTRRATLAAAGCEVLTLAEKSLPELFAELGRRRLTNVLVEGGASVLGECLDQRLLDEVHIFIAPKIVGGTAAPSAIGGSGVERMADALQLANVSVENIEGDVYVKGRTGQTRRLS